VTRPAGPLVVVGDSLLDVDLQGRVERLSPEAPVPVVDVAERRHRPGGAALAAAMAARSGREVVLVTPLAEDEGGSGLTGLLSGIEVIGLPMAGGTVCKTRVRAGDHPLLRVDSGTGRAADGPLPARVAEVLALAGAVLVADYGRGTTASAAVRAELSRHVGRLPLVWDPHPRGAEPVPGATLVTPNAAEAAALGGDDIDHGGAGLALCERWQADAVAVTVGSAGAVLTQRHSLTTAHIPTPELSPTAAGVLDTCGAGDRFATAATAALQDGATVLDATRAGVEAATAYVYGGAATAMSTVMTPDARMLSQSRAAAGEDVWHTVDRVRHAGGRIVATGGCFDLLHSGHVSLLESARALGDLLVVCLNSDASVRRAKGPDRPVVGEQDRARVLNALSAVDGVVIFDEDTPAEMLARLQPDIWVKGSDYAGRVLPEEQVLARYGGRLVLIPTQPGYSTSRLVQTVRLHATSLSERPTKETA
jgi:D-beta-D-heptose 7-phosphate kinase/D-beta-D-heptose 1-phosphate adenosyltransferase